MVLLAGGGLSAPTPAAALIVTDAFFIQRRVLPLRTFTPSQLARQRRQPTPRKTKDHFTLDGARGVSQLAAMMHDKGIRARVVRHFRDIRQL